MDLPLSRPDLTERERELVAQVLQSTILSQGPMLARFEAACAAYVGVPYGVGVTNGTCGLHLAVVAAGIAEGDEVITTPFSFVASSNCVLYERARPVFVDIDPKSGNIDPAGIESAVTPRTRAILPVHIFGHPADMEAITAIARRRDLIVIEDACEALGAERDGHKVGSFGHAAVFAFYPNKQMTTGEGGIVVTRDPAWDERLRSLRNQGRGKAGTWLEHERLGYNYRLDEIRSALGVAQLDRITELLARRERVARLYTERLQSLSDVQTPEAGPGVKMSWFVYVVRLGPRLDRDRIALRLQAAGVPTRPYFSVIHLQSFYRERFGYRGGEFPMAEQLARSTLALPFHGRMGEAEVDQVCRALTDAIQQG
jgi:perosamine synthetase